MRERCCPADASTVQISAFRSAVVRSSSAIMVRYDSSLYLIAKGHLINYINTYNIIENMLNPDILGVYINVNLATV